MAGIVVRDMVGRGEYMAAEAADTARQGGGSLMAWPADEPYVLPTLGNDTSGVKREQEKDGDQSRKRWFAKVHGG
ncbi:hypothetical protein QBC46DRAFT_348320 [Diplogelasinospora grovesii]|uniref:Uncharacterized protein n=1 Tax=Diplogelasinospora grovesii TaxID=303347 RepID=A0AAN6MVE8_9PEZI|nr:hypothetical protein QBC46DRAFT_348320 [Diplogelasinospora grovesii]